MNEDQKHSNSESELYIIGIPKEARNIGIFIYVSSERVKSIYGHGDLRPT
jgi:hypothetical protein